MQRLKKYIQKYETLVRKNPADGSYRHAFYSCRSKFRRLCHYEAKQFNRSILHAITNNMDSDPKTFWNLINKLSKSSTETVEENIQHDKFIKFFETLNTDETINNEFQINITSELHTLESQNVQLDTTNSELNKEINTDEIMKAIKSL